MARGDGGAGRRARRGRLSRSADFDRVFREGRSHANRHLVLYAFPRMLGYVFNPISFWLCHDAAGAVRAVLCEVRNTFGEQHNYLLAHPDGRALAFLTARGTGEDVKTQIWILPMSGGEAYQLTDSREAPAVP